MTMRPMKVPLTYPVISNTPVEVIGSVGMPPVPIGLLELKVRLGWGSYPHISLPPLPVQCIQQRVYPDLPLLPVGVRTSRGGFILVRSSPAPCLTRVCVAPPFGLLCHTLPLLEPFCPLFLRCFICLSCCWLWWMILSHYPSHWHVTKLW